MPQRLFEGPSLEQLLHRARQEFGPHARVVRAERGRRGLLGGLFARDHYELVIETGDEASGRETGGQPASGVTLPLGSADLSLRNERGIDVRAAATALLFARLGGGPVPSTPGAPWSLTADSSNAALSPLEQLLVNTTDTVSLSTDLLPTCGDHIARATSAPAPCDGSAETRTTGVTEAVVLDAVDSPPTASTTTLTALPAHYRVAPPSLIEGVESPDPASTALAAADCAMSSPPASLPVEPPVEREPSFSTLLDRITQAAGAPQALTAACGAAVEAVSQPLSESAPSPAPATPLPLSVGSSSSPGRTTAVPAGALTALGVPGSWISDRVLTEPDLSALTALLALAPSAPAAPTAAGQRLLLVGTVAQAGRVAEHLADVAGLGRDKIHLALPPEAEEPEGPWTDRPVLRSFHDALRTVEATTEHDDALVVVVAAPVGARHLAWTSRLVACLDPDAVWGVAPAAAKPEDLLDWAVRLGGLTALALHDLDVTTSPASALTTGIPIALLDAAPATPARWAGILIDRLGERPPLALPL